MNRARFFSLSFALLCFLMTGRDTTAFYPFPPLPPQEQYGNILINRTSEKNKVKSVTFSHWSHRLHYTCRVCHLELEFNMQLNTTEITEEANKAGKFCGACHNDKAVFGHTRDNCEKCHNGDKAYGKEKFAKLADLPKTKYGNKVDWVKALQDGLIKPKNFIYDEARQIAFDRLLELQAENYGIPPAVFPHSLHTQWLDCSNCHPDIFNIKKKTTKHFSMSLCLKGQFCGLCHLRTAFPLNDCKRCHPAMSDSY
jgi:c(7)-type cytochrome triheme protein